MHRSEANHPQHPAKKIKNKKTKTTAATAIQQTKRKDGDGVLQEDRSRRPRRRLDRNVLDSTGNDETDCRDVGFITPVQCC